MKQELPLERVTTWQAAYDKRAPEPSKNYGIHGVECVWILKGPKGAIAWTIFTNWQLPHVVREGYQQTQGGDVSDMALKCRFAPTGAGVEFHSRAPLFEGQEARKDCTLTQDGTCYWDIGYLLGERFLTLLIGEGGEAVWQEMEKHYHELPALTELAHA